MKTKKIAIENRLKPKKYLGQIFLKCSSAIKKMVEAAEIKPDDIILEIGPGTGVLTYALTAKAKWVVAVEKDERLAENLKNNLAEKKITNIDIIAADILKFLKNPTALNFTGSYKVVANIPYYLTSRLIRLLMESPNRPTEIVLLIQKEVAERIVAEPPRMNLLALGVKTYGKPKIISLVPSSCFWPKPKVDSAIIKISEISSDFFEKNKVGEKQFFELAKAAFSQKRKTIANSLAKMAESKDEAIKIISGIAKREPLEFPSLAPDESKLSPVGSLGNIKKSGVDPQKRPEELSLNDWLVIYKNWLI